MKNERERKRSLVVVFAPEKKRKELCARERRERERTTPTI